MKNWQRTILLALAVFSANGYGQELRILLQPEVGLGGAVALNISNGTAVLETYQKAQLKKQLMVPLGEDQIEQLSDLAEEVFSEFIQRKSVSSLPQYPFSLSITEIENGIEKTVASRHLNKAGETLLRCLEPLMAPHLGQYVKR